MSNIAFLLLALCLLNEVASESPAFTNDEIRLVKSLWKNYDSRVRPTNNASESVHVSWRTLLLDVLGIDQKCTMTLDVFVEMSWRDASLVWNPIDFGGIAFLHRPVQEIWRPDINLVFSVGHEEIVLGDRIATINSTGNVRWSPHLRLHALTPTDLTYFPYDRHRFHVTLVSWLPKNMQDFLVPDEDFGVKFFDVDIEWRMKAVHVKSKDFQNSDDVLAGVFYLLDVERRATFYVFFIIYPAAIVGCLSLLTFLLSPDQRFIFCSVLFLCLLVVAGILQNYLPIGMVKAPIIASIMAYEFFVIFFIFSCSILTFNVRNRDPRKSKIPALIKKIFLNKFLRFICLLESSTLPSLATTRGEEATVAYSQLTDNESNPPTSELPSSSIQEQRAEVNNDINKTIDCLSKMLDAYSDDKKRSGNDWICLANVLDKILLLLVSVMSAIVVGKLCLPSD